MGLSDSLFPCRIAVVIEASGCKWRDMCRMWEAINFIEILSCLSTDKHDRIMCGQSLLLL